MDVDDLLSSIDTDELREKIETGDLVFYLCPNCVQFIDEPVQVRECSNENCGCRFNGTDNGRNCEDCNKPFTRKLTEKGCPDCLEEDEVDEFSLEQLEEELSKR